MGCSDEFSIRAEKLSIRQDGQKALGFGYSAHAKPNTRYIALRGADVYAFVYRSRLFLECVRPQSFLG